MQLELSDRPDSNDDDSFDFVEVTLFPKAPSAEDASTTPSDVKAIFEAVANCSNLHPNPSSDVDEEMGDDDAADRIVFEGNVGYEGISGLPGVQRGTADGGLPPPFPGSGGWITAENVSEYFDEEGNFIGGGEGDGEALGEGAGRVRTRDEADGEEEVNGNGREDADDHKRPRAE
jgi:chloride channel, nucleotide-sensitive, 1A